MPEQDDEQSPDMFLSTSIYHSELQTWDKIQQAWYFLFLIKLRYTLTCEMTAQENEMARCTGEPALGSGSVHGPCGLANILYYLLALIHVITTHAFLWPAC